MAGMMLAHQADQSLVSRVLVLSGAIFFLEELSSDEGASADIVGAVEDSTRGAIGELRWS